MPELLAAFKFEKNGDTLKLLVDTEYTVGDSSVKMYMEYEFDANGYLKYRKESTGDGTTGESIEFTAKVYNRTKDLEVDAFLTYLRELEHLSYEDVRYATVSATNIEQEGTNPQTTKTGDFNLVYYIDSQGQELARARITNEQGDVTTSVTVLGLSHMMSATVETAENGEYAVKRVGSNYDVTAELDDAESHIHIITHYVFDMNGYVLYMSYQGEGYSTEFTATAYNKVATTNALAGKTFTVVSVEEANDPTYNDYLSSEFAVYIGSTVEFKTNETFEWTTDRVAIFGTYTVNGNAGTYTQIGWIENGETEEIPIENRMALDIAVSGNDIVLTVVFVIGGESGAYDMVDCHINATLNNNL